MWGSTFNPRFLDKSEQLPEKSKLGLNEVEIKPKCWLIPMGTRHWKKKKVGVVGPRLTYLSATKNYFTTWG